MASRKVKALWLFFILGIPVLLYLFLQGFGENQYDVPILYEDGLTELKSGCQSTGKPHSVGRFIESGPCSSWDCQKLKGKLVLFNFKQSGCDQRYFSEIARVINQYRNNSSLVAVTISMDTVATNQEVVEQVSQYQIEGDSWLWWLFDEAVFDLVACGFNLETGCSLTEKAVLIDPQSRIRGNYDLSEAAEVDRLITEIAILLQNNAN